MDKFIEADLRPSQKTAPLRVRRKSLATDDFKKLSRRSISFDSKAVPPFFATLDLPPTPHTSIHRFKMSNSGSPPVPPPPSLPDETPESITSPPAAVPDSPERDVEALIKELRASLSSSQTLLQTQTQRLTHLSDVETELAQFKDQHAFLSAAKEAVENELQKETKRREAAEETVELLRGQVDQARRGVGMLQKQEKDRKRMSMIGGGLPPPSSALGLVGNSEGEELLDKEPTTSKASKRASFIGARTHRRASSNSEHDAAVASSSSRPTPYTSPNTEPPKSGGLRELRLGSLTTPVAGSALISPVGSHFEDNLTHPAPPIGQRTPSNSTTHTTAHVSPPRPSAAEEEAIHLRQELDQARAALAESEEGRMASEACLKALRDFMASGGEGAPPPDDLLREMRLPPLPSDRDTDLDRAQDQDGSNRSKGGSSGWGFKLWRGAGAGAGGTSPPASTIVEPPGTPGSERLPPGSTAGGGAAPSNLSSNTPRVSPLPTPGELPIEGAVQAVPSSHTPLASFVSGWTKGVVPGTPAERPPTGGRKLTSFFSRSTGAAAGKKDDNSNKELPPAPENQDQEDDEDGVIVEGGRGRGYEGGKRLSTSTASKDGGDGLEPSPEIVDLTESEVKTGVSPEEEAGSPKKQKEGDVEGTPKS